MEPIASLAEGTEDHSKVTVSCFLLSEKNPLIQNVDSMGLIAVGISNRKNNQWRKCNNQSFDQTCKYK